MRALALTIALLVLIPAAADAKGVERGEVCGTTRCTDIGGPAVYGVVAGGLPADPPRAQPFVEVHVTFRGDAPPGEPVPHDRLSFRYLPGAELLRDEEGLWRAPADAAAAQLLRDTAADLPAFPAAKLLELAPELEPPRPPEPAQAPASAGAVPWAEIAGGALVALAVAALVGGLRRRRAAEAP